MTGYFDDEDYDEDQEAEDAAYELDQERVFMKAGPVPGSASNFMGGHQATAEEALARCANQVVDMAKCINDSGAMWWYNCRWLHVELQDCYDLHLRTRGYLYKQVQKEFKEDMPVKTERFTWAMDDLLGLDPRRKSPGKAADDPGPQPSKPVS